MKCHQRVRISFITYIHKFWPDFQCPCYVGSIKIFCLILAFFCTPLKAYQQINFKHLTLTHGLSQYSVHTIVQDKFGFLWFGTEDGLNRYDGYQFKVYKHDPYDDTSISSNGINVVYEDNKGRLWVGTQQGLNRYNQQTMQFERMYLPDNDGNVKNDQRIEAIVEDSLGNIWVGTFQGLYAFNSDDKKNEIMYLNAGNSTLMNDQITSLLNSHDNHLWVGTHNGLFKLDTVNQAFTKLPTKTIDKPGIDGRQVTSLFADSTGQIWVGSHNHGITIYNYVNNSFRHINFENNPVKRSVQNRIYAIYQASNGGIWVGTALGASVSYDFGANFNHFYHNMYDMTSLVGDKVVTFFEDRSGVLWLGMEGGASYFNTLDKGFNHIKHIPGNVNSLPEKEIRALYQDNNKLLWVATVKGLSVVDRAKGEFLHFKQGISPFEQLEINNITSILEDRTGTIWLGTYDNGLYLLSADRQSIRQISYQDNQQTGLTHFRIRELFEDSKGNIWIGTQQGLTVYHPETSTYSRFQHQPNNSGSLAHNRIYDVFEDRKGRIWVGTRGGGLHQFLPDKKQFIRYLHDKNKPNSLSHNRVYAIDDDSKGNLWISTKGGLNKLNVATGEFVHFREKHGLPNDTVNAVIVDGSDNVWVSTNQGISKLDPVLNKFTHFNESDGLQSNEFNTHTYYKSNDGEMFFGGINGITSFYPNEIKFNLIPPEIALVDFLVFNQSVNQGVDSESQKKTRNVNLLRDIELAHNENMFSIEFSALHFANPLDNRFRYKLHGFDSSWLEKDASRRFATYTNLSSGRYQFELTASNSDGVWQNNSHKLTINVLPAPWRTWWAYAAYLIIIVSILGTITLQHFRKLKERQQHYLITHEKQKQLELALWASGDELWDINVKTKAIRRLNRPDYLPEGDENHWQVADYENTNIHPDDIGHVKRALKRHFEQKTPFYEVSYRIKTKEGEWLWMNDRGKIVERDSEGAPNRFSGTTKNINALKVTEQELKLLNEELEQRVMMRTNALEKSNNELKSAQRRLIETEKMASLGNLVIGVAHEINTPVGVAITALSHLNEKSRAIFEKVHNGNIRKNVFFEFEKESTLSLELSMKNMKKVSRLVDDFKQILVDGTSEILNLVNLKTLMNSVLNSENIAMYYLAGQIKLNCVESCVIKTFRETLFSILKELIENSINHGFKESRDVKIEIKITKSAQALIINVKDYGEGMSHEDQKKLFDPFFTTNRGHSSGLGMHIVYNKVHQLLGGSIDVKSEIGKGTEIKLHVPLLN